MKLFLLKKLKGKQMKVTKYDVHVHPIENQRVGQEIVGRYFYVANDEEKTIRMAVFHSSLEIFKPYINNPRYIIHMVYGQKLCQCEIDFFLEALSKDSDPANFFMTREKEEK